MADLRRSELHRQLHLEPSDIFAHLYRISTEHNSNDAKRLFLRTFPAYPEIIEQNSRRCCIPSGIRTGSDARLGLTMTMNQNHREGPNSHQNYVSPSQRTFLGPEHR
jgi:hypothetical protein